MAHVGKISRHSLKTKLPHKKNICKESRQERRKAGRNFCREELETLALVFAFPVAMPSPAVTTGTMILPLPPSPLNEMIHGKDLAQRAHREASMNIIHNLYYSFQSHSLLESSLDSVHEV